MNGLFTFSETPSAMLFIVFFHHWRLVAQAGLLLLVGATLTFFIKLYNVRRKFQMMQKQGLPMPLHHPVMGHLLLVGRIQSKLPWDSLQDAIAHQIQLALPELGPTFYLDTWPFGPPLLVTASTASASQITQVHSLPKFYPLAKYLRPMTGGNDLVTMEGVEWKKWRTIFNPGFSRAHLTTLVPQMMEDTLKFCEILRELALKGDMFHMDPVTINLSLDIIGRVTLDTHFNAQQTRNDFLAALRSQVRWLSVGYELNPFRRLNPLRSFMCWWNDRRMVRYIIRELESRFKSNREHKSSINEGRSKTIIDLALDNYLGQEAQYETLKNLDATFRKYATSQMRIFIFAGHDTISSTLCYAFHLLSVYPEVRSQLITEHNQALGIDYKEAASRILTKPHILHQLPYTLAVIKETLRLYPPASTVRSGEPGFFVRGLDGSQYPTDGFMMWSNHTCIHRNPAYWPEPSTFLPERWLSQKGNRLYPVNGAWRAFEHGPRNCIGQELAMLEIILVLAMTTREFDIKSAYDEWDTLNPRSGPKTVNGDRAYQMLFGSAHPSDNLPCRVFLSKD